MAQKDIDSNSVVIVSDYLTNPYVVNMSLARSRSMADRSLGSHGVPSSVGRHKQGFVESLLKQSLPRRSSFSFGSKFIRRDASFPFRIFKSKSSSITFSDSMSTSSNVSCQSNKSTEEFWNQYRRNQPKLSFTLRAKQVQTQIKPVNSIHEKSPTPPPTQNTISLWLVLKKN